MDYDRLLNLTTDLGYQLSRPAGGDLPGGGIHASGAECLWPGAAGGVCHPNCIIVSVTTPRASPITDAAHPGPWDRH